MSKMQFPFNSTEAIDLNKEIKLLENQLDFLTKLQESREKPKEIPLIIS